MWNRGSTTTYGYHIGTAALNGLVSGVMELGRALVFFAFLPVLTFWG